MGEQEELYSLFFKKTLSLSLSTTHNDGALFFCENGKKKNLSTKKKNNVHSGLPPVTAISAPATYVFLGSARNTNAEAHSAGCAARPRG